MLRKAPYVIPSTIPLPPLYLLSYSKTRPPLTTSSPVCFLSTPSTLPHLSFVTNSSHLPVYGIINTSVHLAPPRLAFHPDSSIKHYLITHGLCVSSCPSLGHIHSFSSTQSVQIHSKPHRLMFHPNCDSLDQHSFPHNRQED